MVSAIVRYQADNTSIFSAALIYIDEPKLNLFETVCILHVHSSMICAVVIPMNLIARLCDSNVECSYIHVLEGFSGHTSELTISTADEYNIHFTKHQTVVTVKASSGELYSVPINSAIQFGLLYNPEKQPKKEHIFKNVSDIIALKTLPKVVCATVAYVGESEAASVAENEVLCIKRVHNPMFHGRKSLEVYSLSTGGKKQLPFE